MDGGREVWRTPDERDGLPGDVTEKRVRRV